MAPSGNLYAEMKKLKYRLFQQPENAYGQEYWIKRKGSIERKDRGNIQNK